MTQAFNLSQFANKLNSSGATDNTGLQNSAVTVNAGTGLGGGGSVALGSSVTLTNAGVTSFNGSTGAITFSSSYPGPNFQSFTSSGTFTVPAGITKVVVTVIGGGGGGGGNAYGGNGSTSSFGSYAISGYGGGGGTAYCYEGGEGYECGSNANNANGSSTYSTIKPAALGLNDSVPYGGGGTSGQITIANCSYCNTNGGSSGGMYTSWVTGLTSGANITVTVGTGGAGASAFRNGGNGGAGLVVVAW